ncbi:MAG: hypothetical protein CMG76_02335 [Candidatus Marinimicrobia bacterium]|nr:hypothetical protein [Candidatus Neomarinimicrobiota bacterium]|tara:strand:+ start:200 stop:733 length:534 start_codon:yes stop_codon:yes gene_type:complete
MKNLFKILIPILLLSITLSNDLDLGLGFKYNGNDNLFLSFIGQIDNYKSDNFYQSYKVDFFKKVVICWGECSNTKFNLGLSASYGKYHKDESSHLSYGLGMGIDYFQDQNKLGFYFPVESEFTIVVKDNIGLSFGGMVYPFFNQPNYNGLFDQKGNNGGVSGLGFGLNLKIVDFENN